MPRSRCTPLTGASAPNCTTYFWTGPYTPRRDWRNWLPLVMLMVMLLSIFVGATVWLINQAG